MSLVADNTGTASGSVELAAGTRYPIALAYANRWGSNWFLSATLLQRLTPDHIRGRIFSMDLGLLTLTLAFSTFVTGAAVDRFDSRIVAAALGR